MRGSHQWCGCSPGSCPRARPLWAAVCPCQGARPHARPRRARRGRAAVCASRCALRARAPGNARLDLGDLHHRRRLRFSRRCHCRLRRLRRRSPLLVVSRLARSNCRIASLQICSAVSVTDFTALLEQPRSRPAPQVLRSLAPKAAPAIATALARRIYSGVGCTALSSAAARPICCSPRPTPKEL